MRLDAVPYLFEQAPTTTVGVTVQPRTVYLPAYTEEGLNRAGRGNFGEKRAAH